MTTLQVTPDFLLDKTGFDAAVGPTTLRKQAAIMFVDLHVILLVFDQSLSQTVQNCLEQEARVLVTKHELQVAKLNNLHFSLMTPFGGKC
jgi:hypothetical protein